MICCNCNKLEPKGDHKSITNVFQMLFSGYLTALELYSAVCAVMRIRRIRTSSIPQRRSEGNDDTCSGDWKRYSWPLRTSSRQNAVSAFKDNVELSTVATP